MSFLEGYTDQELRERLAKVEASIEKSLEPPYNYRGRLADLVAERSLWVEEVKRRPAEPQ